MRHGNFSDPNRVTLPAGKLSRDEYRNSKLFSREATAGGMLSQPEIQIIYALILIK
jgi:hypothetical protein